MSAPERGERPTVPAELDFREEAKALGALVLPPPPFDDIPLTETRPAQMEAIERALREAAWKGAGWMFDKLARHVPAAVKLVAFAELSDLRKP